MPPRGRGLDGQTGDREHQALLQKIMARGLIGSRALGEQVPRIPLGPARHITTAVVAPGRSAADFDGGMGSVAPLATAR